MKKEISLELRNKIRRDMLIVRDRGWYDIGYYGILIFDKDKEFELFEECIAWKDMLDTYYKTSYSGGEAKRVGRFFGIKPAEIRLRSVKFVVSDYLKISWKDWFDTEGKEDIPQLFANQIQQLLLK